MKVLKPKYGTIYRVLITQDGFVVLENLRGGSMLYKLDHNLSLIWESDFKNRMLYDLFIVGNRVKIADGTGETCLNADTGETDPWTLTK